MIGEDFEKAVVALACWREAHTEGVNGMLAIALVLRNRAKAGWGGGSIYENAGDMLKVWEEDAVGTGLVRFPDVRDPQFQTLLPLIDEVFDDRRVDNLTNGALYYFDLSTCSGLHPETHSRTAVLGRLTFFK